MRWLGDVWYRLRALFGRGTLERDMEDEFAFHLAMEARKYEARGVDPAEARRVAAVKFGGAERFKEQARGSWGVAPLTDLSGDVRYAVRQLRKNPAFSTLAALTLALGIGGTVALFSVVNGLLIRPLPVREEARVMTLWSAYNWRGEEFDFARERVRTFESLAAWSNDGFTLRTDDGSSLHLATVASAELFDVLGTPPLLGRTFRPGEDRPGAEPVIVLSHALWQQSFGSDPSVVGRRVDINGRPTTVIGVMPRDFYFPQPEMDAWMPLDLDPASSNYQNNGWLVLTGRLLPDVGDAEVRADLHALATALGERWTYPDAWDKTRNPTVTPLRTYVMGDVRPLVLLLLGAVGMVLLMACVNVAALLLTKAADRTGEMSVRAALGAGRLRLARQVLTESVLLGLVAGAAGIGLAALLFDALVASLPLPGRLGDTLALDWSTLLAGLVLSVGAGSLVALAPMRSLLRGNLGGSALGERTQSGGLARSNRLQGGLVVAEVLISVMLATGAALLIRTVNGLRAIDPGLEPQGVLALDVFLPSQAMDDDERALYFQSLTERAQALPGVSSAGLINRLPLRNGGWQGTVRIEDRPDLGDPARRPNSYWRAVTPGTFDALGARVVRGRAIEPADAEGSAQVVVVNETFARRMWGTQDPLGRRIAGGFGGGEWKEVVGVVADIAVTDLVGETPMAMYVPWDQALRTSVYALLVLKTGGDASALAAPARALVSAVDDRAAVGRAETMDHVMDGAMAEPLRLRFFLGLFSFLGIVLGTVGIYGVVSYSVQRRRAEFGIRMALGANPERLLTEVVRDGMVPALLGVAGGMGASLLGSAVLGRYLYGVAPTDLTALAWSAGALTLAGLLAAALPAWRASSTHPAVALRSG
jgi:predicted permease